jgi:hypothetical protein
MTGRIIRRSEAVPFDIRHGDQAMDAFEQLVSDILWMDGYWVRTSFKVQLTKAQKRRIDRPTSPRWELDIVAYGGGDNVLRVVECKSLLDSRGVTFRGLTDPGNRPNRYKLFADATLRKQVFKQLARQLTKNGACPPDPTIKLCLACGRIASNTDREQLAQHFAKNGWDLWDETWLRERLKQMSELGYENQVSAVVAKLLLRGGDE